MGEFLVRGSIVFCFRVHDVVAGCYLSQGGLLHWTFSLVSVSSHSALNQQLIHDIALAMLGQQSDKLCIFLLQVINILHGLFIFCLNSLDLSFVQIFLLCLDLLYLNIYLLFLNFKYITHSFEQLCQVIMQFL